MKNKLVSPSNTIILLFVDIIMMMFLIDGDVIEKVYTCRTRVMSETGSAIKKNEKRHSFFLGELAWPVNFVNGSLEKERVDRLVIHNPNHYFGMLKKTGTKQQVQVQQVFTQSIRTTY
jgi:hypothetical protein